MGCVYYNPHTVEMKKLESISEAEIKKAFGKKDLMVFTDSMEMTDWLRSIDIANNLYLMMSSGNFNGINLQELF
jgi:UDP-N-acetylmuramate: L-alanyl-gamma-D-glutamyl-meso-diaminopimelate ligase